MPQNWKSVWDARRLDSSRGSRLAQLMAADGLDTGFGDVDEASWRRFVQEATRDVGLACGDSLFEVGCGAGAFLYEPYLQGVRVAGIDQSASLVGFARDAMPEGRFAVADARSLSTDERFDVVAACGVLLYFPSLDYARDVIARMADKATRAVALFDLADAATQADAIAFRRASLGAAEYADRYAGLDHLFFERSWIRDTLAQAGLTRIRIENQRIAGYKNGAFRFNALAWRSP